MSRVWWPRWLALRSEPARSSWRSAHPDVAPTIDGTSGAVSRWSIRRPVFVVVLWWAAVVASFAVGVGVFGRLVSDVGAVPGSESERAHRLIGRAGSEPIELTAIVHGAVAAQQRARVEVEVRTGGGAHIPAEATLTARSDRPVRPGAALLRLTLPPLLRPAPVAGSIHEERG